MKRKMCLVGVLVFSFLCVTMLAAIPAGAEGQAKIMGTVVQKGNDEAGNYSCAIQSESAEYEVTFSGRGRDLMMMSNKKVEATGYIREVAGKRTITITDYRVLE